LKNIPVINNHLNDIHTFNNQGNQQHGRGSDMNLFEDDFYSTRVSKQRNRTKGFRGITIMLLAGVMIMVFLIGLSVSDDSTQTQVMNAGVESVDEMELRRNLNDLIVQAVEHVNPTIVSVLSTQKDVDLELGVSMGTGVIFKINKGTARIITNNHVIESASDVEIVLLNGQRKSAEIVGMDLLSDLAVLEVDEEGIEYAADFGDSDELKSGQTAIAIGNPLGLGFSHTTTVGVISSPLRTIPVSLGYGGTYDWELDVIQTDAAINQGNSGGALLNLDGQVIGINSLKVAIFGVEGMGFAIPINTAKPIIASLIEYGKVMRPFMGIGTVDVQEVEDWESLNLPDDVAEGIIVKSASGPAQEAQLRIDDIIVSLDDTEVGSVFELRKYLYAYKKVGDTVKVHFYRDGKKLETILTLGEME
jgi:serine protease Do